MLPSVPFFLASLALAGHLPSTPVLAQNTTNVAACKTVCSTSNGTVLDLNTVSQRPPILVIVVDVKPWLQDGFPATCSDKSIQQYAQCLDCIAVTVEPANEDTVGFQQPVDDLVQDCTKAGFPVHSATTTGSYQAGSNAQGGASPSSARGLRQMVFLSFAFYRMIPSVRSLIKRHNI
ncbi:hypothetical protein C8R46DRAFT_1226611 [Mycena filopes]|nr:hypothetical protein C8R46DRAFT_1226611 [Mycena filopes]